MLILSFCSNIMQSAKFESYANIFALARIRPSAIKTKSDCFVTAIREETPAFVVPGRVVSSNLSTGFLSWKKGNIYKKALGLYIFEHDLRLFESALGTILGAGKAPFKDYKGASLYFTTVSDEGTFMFSSKKSDAKPDCEFSYVLFLLWFALSLTVVNSC
jgi:hypothetical protein